MAKASFASETKLHLARKASDSGWAGQESGVNLRAAKGSPLLPLN